MPLVRKIIQQKTSFVITLPKSWLSYLERIYGIMPTEVTIEVNDELRVRPVLPERNTYNKGEMKDG